MDGLKRMVTLGQWVVVLALIASTSLVAAQSGGENANWDNLSKLTPGQKIRIVLNDAKTYEGKFQSVTDEAIVVRLETGDQNFTRQDVLRVSSKGASHRGRNALIGAGVGAAAALVIDASTCSDCNGGTWAGDTGGCALLGAILGATLSKDPWHDVYRAR
jgi:hypothetical protein